MHFRLLATFGEGEGAEAWGRSRHEEERRSILKRPRRTAASPKLAKNRISRQLYSYRAHLRRWRVVDYRVGWWRNFSSRGEFAGHGSTGRSFTLRGCRLFHVVDGKILFQRGYWDKAAWFGQLGIPLEPERQIKESPAM